MTLAGARVLVAGAGFSGLVAARDLTAMGADVTVVEARERVGGRVLTAREGFTGDQHAEAGGDLIDDTQHEICRLTGQLGLKLTPILRGGFGFARQDARGQTRIVPRSSARGWDRLSERLSNLAEAYRLAERQWESPIAADIARRSVAQWLDEIGADNELRTTATALRGFFLADPDELSLIAFVDQFAENDTPGRGQMYRIDGGNDCLAAALAAPLGNRLRLNTEVVAISQHGGNVRATLKHRRRLAQLHADYVVFALPAPLLRRIPMTPALPSEQRRAIESLKYGRATKTLVQFSRRFWRTPGRPRALGSALPIGAVWDGNEEQRGRPGILSLLAGGSASEATQDLFAKQGVAGFARSLGWLGAGRAHALACRQFVWENDVWARGGYAFFDPAFEPSLRPWLARPSGCLFFAGEHTSIQWQGYMNGAIESGRRAAAEVAAAHTLKQRA